MQPCTCQKACADAMRGSAPAGCRMSWPYALEAEAPPEAPPTSATSRILSKAASVAAIGFMLFAAIITWPQSLGGPFKMVVVSGTSMEPWLHTGDLVLAMKKPDYQVGDAIVYSAQEDGEQLGRVIHRIIRVNPDGTFITQGDNKDFQDPWDIDKSWVHGEVLIMIPNAYFVLSIWKHPIFLAAMSGLLLTTALWPRDPLSQPPSGQPLPLPPPPQDKGRRRRGKVKAKRQ